MADDWWKEHERKDQFKATSPSSGGEDDKWWKAHEIPGQQKVTKPTSSRPSTPESRFNDPLGIDKATGKLLKKHTPDWAQSLFGKLPGDDEISPPTMARELVKGIPIAGRYVPQNDEMTKMEQDYPNLSKTAQIAGGTMATMPLGILAQGGKMGFLPTLGRQGTLNAGLNSADTIIQEGTDVTTEDMLKSIGTGYGTGAIAGGINKVLSPGRLPTKSERMAHKEWDDALKGFDESIINYTRLGVNRMPRAMDRLEATTKALPTPPASNATPLSNAMTDLVWGAGGAGIAHLAGQHPLAGVALGVGAHHLSPHLAKAGREFKGNTQMQDPTKSALMNAILENTYLNNPMSNSNAP